MLSSGIIFAAASGLTFLTWFRKRASVAHQWATVYW